MSGRPGAWKRATVALLTTVALATTTAAMARSQDPAPLPPAAPTPAVDTVPTVPVADTIRTLPDTLYPKAPASPMGALWRSILIPGWGQAKSNRKLTGALFVLWEGVTLGMSIKTQHELNYLRRTDSDNESAKEKERQDWLVLLAFNHLFSAIEAYVSAHLWDFPDDLEIRATPIRGGGVGAAIRLPFRFP